MKYFLKKLLDHEIFRSSLLGYEKVFETFVKPSAPPPPTYLIYAPLRFRMYQRNHDFIWPELYIQHMYSCSCCDGFLSDFPRLLLLLLIVMGDNCFLLMEQLILLMKLNEFVRKCTEEVTVLSDFKQLYVRDI